MATEQLIVTALPYTAREDAPFHVSLFVAPRLVADAPIGQLGEFAHFPRWADVVAQATELELWDQHGPIDAKLVLDPLDTAAWEAAFPPETPVLGPARPDLKNRHWRTFRAATVHDAGKLLHAAAMFSDPTSPPLPSRHPLTRLVSQYGHGRQGYDESLVTATFDPVVGEYGHPREYTSLESIEKQLQGTRDPLQRVLLEVHRARRFYERPESQADYQERPTEGATTPPVERPEPDFHQRCALAADHPALLRALGLVVDVRVADPARLRTSAWLSARLVPQGDTGACQVTRTSCAAAGDDVCTVSETGEWVEGRLRLGDEERFRVLDVDPDGTALKLDRFIWTLPRLAAAEANGDPVHAAPTALRSNGFVVARHERALGTRGRLDRQDELLTVLDHGEPPLLATEDVTRGLRVEVWDDSSERWFSLHARRADVEVLGHGTVLDDLAEEGFVQGTAVSESPDVEGGPVHAHEAVFGWEGWSLSAPRPGRRIRHEAGDEVVEEPDADPDPVTPIVISTRVEPGTLPRLRFGRSYAFRAWAVDLAGNSRPHDLTGEPPDEAIVAGLAAAVAVRPPSSLAVHGLTAPLRAETLARVLEPRFAAESPASEVRLDPTVELSVATRLRERRLDRLVDAAGSIDRAGLVRQAFTTVLGDPDQPMLVETALEDPRRLAVAVAVGRMRDPGAFPGRLPDPVAELDAITRVRPFLRWDPVAPPAIVTRHPFSAGESLRQIVIRSGVTQDLDTLAITVEPPAAYAAAQGLRATSERHLAPPKTSQVEAELHGLFDAAIGSTSPADHRTLLAVALREAGSLFDVDVPRLDDPIVRDPQPGLSLAHEATVPPSTLKSLPLPRGEAPAPGQYVVHDTDALVLPYLPDALARGISVVFPEAGRDRLLGFPFGTEGVTARFDGPWPALAPFRLVLEGTEALTGAVAGSVLTFGLPPGDVQRLRLASCLDRADLDLLGLWRMLPATVRADDDVAEAAADGWLWAFTPSDDVTLVHAVPRPLEAPRPTKVTGERLEGATDVTLVGAVDVHGPSTESLTAEARWVDPVDDLSLPGPEERSVDGVAFTTSIAPDEDLAVLWTKDGVLPVPGAGLVRLHAARHQLGDTHHREIDYRFRATTRYREYFDAAQLAPVPPPPDAPPGRPVDDGRSVVGPTVRVTVRSSARPAAPIVHSVVPLFRWETSGEPEQPVAVRRRRRAGLRLYLHRPWYSSGAGELLGVLVAPFGNDVGLEPWVSQWGADPAWLSAPVARRGLFLEMDNLLRAAGLDDRPGDALPVVAPATLPLAAVAQRPSVTVLGYRPQYNVARQLWYVDVAIDPGATFWPFVRLAVARYQPDSVTDCHLSAPVRCDFAPLTPERTTSVSRTDVRHVRVVVSGPVGVRPWATRAAHASFPTDLTSLRALVELNRTVVARLERRHPAIPSDLGWVPVTTTALVVRGHGRSTFEAAWVGTLEAPEDLALTRPGGSSEWRVVVEEWERLPGDPPNLAQGGPPVWEERLIFADEIAL